jgi:hypothetical protein
MTLIKTRIVVAAAVFAANLALSLSYGTAEAEVAHHAMRQPSQHHLQQIDGPSAIPAGANPMMMKREMAMRADDDFSAYCGFSGANAC